MTEINILYAQPDVDEDANAAIIEQILTRSNRQILFKGNSYRFQIISPLFIILHALRPCLP